ncbi:MAG: hypothetical protein JNJ77_02005 [Planctomycetia bacterium]|nr:hypothetical protein [Planctomycetia bacterium]
MHTAINNHVLKSDVLSSLDLHLIINDRNILAYLAQFEDEEVQCEKALEAIKVGVIAIQSASPTLDTQVVQAKFAEVETRMKEQMGEFQKKVSDDLVRYFAENDGVVPRSIDVVFGDKGAITRTFQTYFDPTEGKLSRLMQAQIGPQSTFGKALDPQNKSGVIAMIETRVQELVEAKLNEVLKQFSLDTDGSAMSRLKEMLSDFYAQLNQSLGIKAATEAEAEKGHVKGIVFEEDLYGVFAEAGSQLGDDTELVRGTVGAISRCKKGDYVATLGETSGAPGLRIVVEVKDQSLRLKDAIDELQEAKKNRDAVSGIYVYTRGNEPAEVGDFRRIGEDFYVTVDKAEIATGKQPMFLDCAYKIARALAVAASRKEEAGELDLQQIQDHLDALGAWSDRIADMATKARTIQSSGKLIEQCANDLKLDLDARVAATLKLLQKS